MSKRTHTAYDYLTRSGSHSTRFSRRGHLPEAGDGFDRESMGKQGRDYLKVRRAALISTRVSLEPELFGRVLKKPQRQKYRRRAVWPAYTPNPGSPWLNHLFRRWIELGDEIGVCDNRLREPA